MDTEKKPFFKSKIALFALTLIAVFGGNLLFNFVSGEVSPDQIAAIEQTYPQVVEIIERLKQGESVLSLLGTAIGVIIFIARTWFTTTPGITLK